MEAYFEQKLLPAVSFEDANKAVKVAEAFLEAGLYTMEIPFRTAEAAKAVKLISSNFPQMYIGAGTLLRVSDLKEAQSAGAKFGLSPGLNPKVLQAAKDLDFDFIPGVMTPSELELGMEMGFDIQKLFPVAQLGGLDMLKALHGPYSGTGVRLLPMGGISLHNMLDYLHEPMVIAVGGSWLAEKSLIAQDDISLIKANVEAALAVIRKLPR
jgi:2-dehydro-3-deoxyphosphogluconate aldolase / (4S)-4-hydroxy-2-oxoglutarate aldolase